MSARPQAEISSLRNPLVVSMRDLHRAADRRARNLTLIEGPHLVTEAIDRAVVRQVLWTPGRDPSCDAVAVRAREMGLDVRSCTAAVLQRVADTITPHGIVASIERPHPAPIDSARLSLVVDGVQDPGNVGALVRTAAAAGATEVVCTIGTADPYGPKAMRAGAGAQFRLPIRIGMEPNEIAPWLENAPLYVAMADGMTAYSEVDWTAACALAIGAESQGVSPVLRECARTSVRIPLHAQVESLNAAAAAAVVLFEAARQRAAPRLEGPSRG